MSGWACRLPALVGSALLRCLPANWLLLPQGSPPLLSCEPDKTGSSGCLSLKLIPD